MELFFTITQMFLFCAGLLYPSFRLCEVYTNCAKYQKDESCDPNEKKEKIKKYAALMKRLIKHFVVMVLLLTVTTFTDIFLRSSDLYNIAKCIVMFFFMHKNFSGAVAVMNFLQPKLTRTFSFLFSLAEHSTEKKTVDSAHFFLTHFATLFMEQYEYMMSEIDEDKAPRE